MRPPFTILPPKNWKDFETLTKEVATLKLNINFDFYGRDGQNQDGVDLFSRDSYHRYIGIQCKSRKSKSDDLISTISETQLKNWIKEAQNFRPNLHKFIIATTTFTDTKVQDILNKINDIRIRKKLFTVEIWFWEVFELELNKHSSLLYLFYKDILVNYNFYNKDKHIVAFLFNTLNRPAFYTLFDCENNCDDFLQAIIDTQRALTTGELYDRDGKILSSSYPSINLSNKKDKETINKISDLLQKIRDFTTEQKKLDNFVQSSKDFFHIRNDYSNKISENLNMWRREILVLFNELAGKHKIDLIESKLLDKKYNHKYY